jgi:Tfp pilus assembly PilM family ATPase
MRQIPILSNIWNFLTAPKLPGTSLAITETHLALITLRYRGRQFEPRNLGVGRLPVGLVTADFLEPNIADEPAMIEHLKRTATQAGMSRLKALSASLPTGSARSLVISLDSVPDTRDELTQMIEWKVERGLGQKYGDLRVNYQRLRDFNGRSQWIISAVGEKVIGQYEQIFNALGWQTGLIVPKFLGEAQWLIRSKLEEDQVVVSLNNQGFAAVIVRGDEPILVREVVCPYEERENEFYRLMIFYRDRLLTEDSPITLNRALIIGNVAEQRSFRDVLSSALEKHTVSLDPQQLGLRVDPNAPFDRFAAAGGLATMAWG